MPTVTPLSDIAAMAADTIVQCVRGKVTGLFKRITGQKKDGAAYSFENGTISGDGVEVRFTLNNCEPLDKNLKGKVVLICCNHGKHGWTGVKVKDDDYDGKTRKILWITPSGKVEIEGAAQSSLPPPNEAPSDTPPPSTRRPASPSGKVSGEAGREAYKNAKRLISRMANMMIRIDGAATVVSDAIGQEEGEPLSAERHDAIRTTLFIQASYEKLYHHFPPLSTGGADKPPAPPTPPPPPELSDPGPIDDDVPF